jgi:hypothetical protein
MTAVKSSTVTKGLTTGVKKNEEEVTENLFD